MENGGPQDVYLICNAKYHGTDFARLELLKLLKEQEDVRVRVSDGFSDSAAIQASKLLITYTCDVYPNEEEQAGLKEFLAGGGRWFALHATGAIIEFVPESTDADGNKIPGHAATPDKAPEYMKMLGHRFIAHPPNQKFTVRVVAHNHPVVSGIEDFETFDEPYYSEYEPGIQTLLEANYTTPATGYGVVDWDEDIARPQMYEHEYQDGRVLYLSLGHCRDKYDMQPMIDVVEPERCSWDLPVYYELLRRGIAWGLGQYKE